MSISRQSLQWDPRSVEIRTKSVEETLAPLIRQVTTLVNHYNRQHRKGSCSKRAPQLVRDIENATKHLVEVGEAIADDFPEMKEAMLEACQEARDAGDTMQKASNEFAKDPCNPQKRNSMVRAARALLSSVTRLLCVADMADVQRLMERIHSVDEHLKCLVNIGDMDELLTSFKNYGHDLMNLTMQSGQRQADLKNQRYKDEMAAARSSLKHSSRLLYTASKAYINHPDADSALENRDYAINELDEALTTIGNIAQAYGDATEHPFEKTGSLAALFDDILALLVCESEDFYQKTLQKDIQSLVEEIVEGCTRIGETIVNSNSMKEKIFAECRNMKSALSVLLDSCIDAHSGKVSDIEVAKSSMQRRTIDMSKLIQYCIIGSVADSFLNTNVPLVLLMEATDTGDIEAVKEHSAKLLSHTAKLVEIANLACNICSNAERIKMVKLSAQQIGAISQQVSNSAITLAKYPQSKSARENMHMFRNTWLKQMAILTEAVDDITTLDDFLMISELRLLENIDSCVNAVHSSDVVEINSNADAIRERIWRVSDMIMGELKNHELGEHTENIERCVTKVKTQDLTSFLVHVENVGDGSNIDKVGFEESARTVYKSFQSVRKAVRISLSLQTGEVKILDLENSEENTNKDVNTNVVVTDMKDDKPQMLAYKLVELDELLDEISQDNKSEVSSKKDEEEKALRVEEEKAQQQLRQRQSPPSPPPPTPPPRVPLLPSSIKLNLKLLSDEEQLKIDHQRSAINNLAEGLEGDKDRVLSEVSKWEEQGNAIIVTVKRMCKIMMDLSNFSRGTGELKTSMDVIKASEKIAKHGSTLNELVRELARDCPHSHTKSDMLAYIQRIALYSHQLTVTSRVKADVSMIGGEAIIMDIDTVKSLIETARNLMNSVMLTVRSSYIASTKHRTESVSATTKWQMASPEKKSLVDSSDYGSYSSSIESESRYNLDSL